MPQNRRPPGFSGLFLFAQETTVAMYSATFIFARKQFDDVVIADVVRAYGDSRIDRMLAPSGQAEA